MSVAHHDAVGPATGHPVYDMPLTPAGPGSGASGLSLPVFAGYCLARCFDHVHSMSYFDATVRREAEDTLAVLNASPERTEEIALLTNVLADVVAITDARSDAANGAAGVLATSVRLYAEFLERNLRLPESAAILERYESVFGNDPPGLAAEMTLFLARTCRELRQLDAAWAAYARASRYGRRRWIGMPRANQRAVVLSWIGRGTIWRNRGNLPRAKRQYRRAIRAAQAMHDREIEARATHDLAGAMHRGGEYERAIVHAYRAFVLYETVALRCRALNDLGHTLMQLGHHPAAQNALRISIATTGDLSVRASAQLELMDSARMTGSADLYREQWSALAAIRSSLPPEHQLDFHVKSACGLLAFHGDRTGAVAELAAGLEIAERYQLGEFIISIDEALDRVQREREATGLSPSPSEDLAAIAGALAEGAELLSSR